MQDHAWARLRVADEFDPLGFEGGLDALECAAARRWYTGLCFEPLYGFPRNASRSRKLGSGYSKQTSCGPQLKPRWLGRRSFVY